MKVAWILLFSLLLVFILDESDAFRFRVRVRVRRITRKILPRIRGRKLFRKLGRVVQKTFKTIVKAAIITNPQLLLAKTVFDKYKAYKASKKFGDNSGACEGSDICGGACVNSKCRWHCDNICNVIVDDKFTNWPGDIVPLPCKFSEYDSLGIGYFEPADLAYQIGERGREPDNMMVFNKLDQNGDGKVTETEFNNTKDILLKDGDSC